MKKYIILCLITLTFIACQQSNKPEGHMITVSIEPLRYFTEQIAGPYFTVSTMVPNGGNPETFEPTAQQMIHLSKSVLYIKVGEIGFERTWMEQLKQNAPHTIIVNSSEGVDFVQSGHHISDPHTWMSTRNAVIIAQNICSALVKIDKKNEAVYQQNLARLIKTIEQTDQLVRQELSTKNVKAFLIYHPALTYFARDYNLLQIAVEDEGHEPSAAQLKNTINLARQHHAKVMFIQKEFISRNTQIVNKGAGSQAVEINPLAYEWDKEMVSIARKLK